MSLSRRSRTTRAGGPALGSVVEAGEHVFTARNAAEWAGGAFVYVRRGVKVEAPIVLDAIQAQAGTALNWRVLVVLEDGRGGRVWEQYTSTADGLFTTVTSWSSARTRGCASSPARSSTSAHGSSAPSGRASRATARWTGSCSASARATARSSKNTILEGEGAEGKVTAPTSRAAPAPRLRDDQEHVAANCNSDLAFRGILGGRSSVVCAA